MIVPPVVVMGVSGSGKTTIGALLAARLGVRFVDADDLHPAANKNKMAAGLPLTDADRLPWLRRVAECLGSAAGSGDGIVVACSALRRVYREALVIRAPGTVFVHLTGSQETIGSRLAGRRHEYMPASLLGSQLSTLEPLEPDERGLLLDVGRSPETMVEDAVRELLRFAADRDRAD